MRSPSTARPRTRWTSGCITCRSTASSGGRPSRKRAMGARGLGPCRVHGRNLVGPAMVLQPVLLAIPVLSRLCLRTRMARRAGLTTDRLNPARVPRETIASRGDVCTHLPRIYDAFCAQHSGSQDGASLARRASSDQGSGTCCAGGVDPNGPSRRLANIYRLRLGWQREYPRSAD